MFYKIKRKEMSDYCKENNIQSIELTNEERKQFIIGEDRDYEFWSMYETEPCSVCQKDTCNLLKKYELFVCSDICFQKLLNASKNEYKLFHLREKCIRNWNYLVVKELVRMGYDDVSISERIEMDFNELKKMTKEIKDTFSLFISIETNDFERVKTLMIESPLLLETRDKFGFTPLIHAIKYEQFELAKWLITKGADVSAKANGGQNSLMWAFQCGNIEMIELLIKQGVDLNEIYYEEEDVSLLSLIMFNWLKSDFKSELLNVISRYEYLLNDEIRNEFRKNRIKALYKIEIF